MNGSFPFGALARPHLRSNGTISYGRLLSRREALKLQAERAGVGDAPCFSEFMQLDRHAWSSDGACCTVELYTHKISGLHENDFIMAAKINALVEG